jgi:hypothetical protein
VVSAYENVCGEDVDAPNTAPLAVRGELALFLDDIVGLGDAPDGIAEELTRGRGPVEAEEGAHAGVEDERRQIRVPITQRTVVRWIGERERCGQTYRSRILCAKSKTPPLPPTRSTSSSSNTIRNPSRHPGTAFSPRTLRPARPKSCR